MEARPTNRLAREKSPYLLQHAHNPVDWFAWGEEAFARARAENKPIFLSIGYSTCHWCHVMERESFEDEAVAAALRRDFVSIKVDREERPDVDKIYMTFVQATTGQGGWPLNVFLAPDLKPFFGGTYFPPDQRHGRPGFGDVLAHIAQLWAGHGPEISDRAGELHERLASLTEQVPAAAHRPGPETLRQALAAFKDAYDPEHGGFGGAPKFPQPAIPGFVLRAAKRFGDDAAATMVLHTCERMAAGGIHDQLGGGFSRYAVDAQWLVPHFEKMLYDNAQLTQLYLDAHLAAGEEDARGHGPAGTPAESPFAATARDILDYVLRDMTQPGGGFYSAEDADSEGHEGKFYCWTQDELSRLLTPEEFTVAADYFGITGQGNFVDHSHPHPLPGQNVLSIARPLDPLEHPSAPPPTGGGQIDQVPSSAALLASAKARMLAARARRVRPHLDDKILASWNGLMLGAFARASAVLNEPRYLVAAEKCLAFIRVNLWEPANRPGAPGILHHRWRDGEHDQAQLVEDYAFLLDGVIHLYEATLEPAHLDFALQLAVSLLTGFHDPVEGGFWQSPAGAPDLILRVKDDYDGAEPSGNSMAALALLKLAAITGRDEFKTAAARTLELAAPRLQTQPAGHACLLQALDFSLEEPARVVIAGDRRTPEFTALLRAAHAAYQPDKIVLGNTGPVDPFAQTLAAKGAATAYLCTGNACQPPTNDPQKLREMLK